MSCGVRRMGDHVDKKLRHSAGWTLAGGDCARLGEEMCEVGEVHRAWLNHAPAGLECRGLSCLPCLTADHSISEAHSIPTMAATDRFDPAMARALSVACAFPASGSSRALRRTRSPGQELQFLLQGVRLFMAGSCRSLRCHPHLNPNISEAAIQEIDDPEAVVLNGVPEPALVMLCMNYSRETTNWVRP